ncbi:MAG: hypothetical protein AB7O97_12715 [Planctomycetota bacterium]
MSDRIAPRSHRLAAVLLAASAAGCATSSAAFVDARPGYAVTRGRLVEVHGLSSTKVTPLKDGVAFELDAASCDVALRFDDGRRQRLHVQAPAIVVCGADTDYVLLPADRAATPALPPRRDG